MKRHYQARIDGQAALDSTCPTLLSLIAKVSDKLAYTTPAAMIGNIIMSSIRNRASSLQVAIGSLLSKRYLIELLHKLGVSCSYDEVLKVAR